MAIQSALTGHLVFSTLHTNDAASAVTRLLDLGIEPYLVGSSLVGVLAQRLVRRNCEHCSEPVEVDPADLEMLQLSPTPQQRAKFRQGVGCRHCRGTGYRGRAGCFELLTTNDEIRRLVGDRAAASEIDLAARRGGMQTLAQDGYAKVLSGNTTLKEVLRVSAKVAL
jgi:type II secretory ATPase GspE/PulE/Tfp pilus assembly ATPase PilB-like protein